MLNDKDIETTDWLTNGIPKWQLRFEKICAKIYVFARNLQFALWKTFEDGVRR